MLIIFFVSVVIHTGQAIRYRMWWLFPTMVVAGSTEMAGWAARVYSSYKPTVFTAYLLQSVSGVSNNAAPMAHLFDSQDDYHVTRPNVYSRGQLRHPWTHHQASRTAIQQDTSPDV